MQNTQAFEHTDEAIMGQVQAGALADLSQLFDRYNVAIYNFFLRFTLDSQVSEDLTQSLFYRILRYRNSFDAGTGSFRSWMYRMARNLYVDHCKEKQRLNGLVKSVADYPEHIPETEEGFKERDFDRLKEAMARLAPADRELIVLNRYEGLKYAEIAEMRNMSLSAVKVQAHRAIKALRMLYFKQQED
ncbi:MAG: RNA polymerase sigma factor [Chitinophagaceae bacterium]